MLTKQEKLAVEIMFYEQGLDAVRICSDPGWINGVCLNDVVKATPTRTCRSSRNTYLYLDGTIKTITEWSRTICICRHTIRERIKRGWTVREALTIPAKKQSNNVSRTI